MTEKTFNLGPHLQAFIGADGVAELIFGPEGGMPFTDQQGHAELGTIWARLAAEPGVRAILVRSVGKGFCAGGTPDVVQGMLDSHEARLRVMREGRAIVQGMIDCDIPIVSAINGAAVGAGAAVALLADISVAGHKAKIIDGHTKIGVAAGDHAAVVWPLLCGMAKAKYHLMLCNTVDGIEAERIGLVSVAVPDDELQATARRIALQLAAGSPSALAFTKRSLNHWLRVAGVRAFAGFGDSRFLGAGCARRLRSDQREARAGFQRAMKIADFHAGQVLSAGLHALSEAAILAFAREYDPQWFHTDATAAANGRFQGLTLGILRWRWQLFNQHEREVLDLEATSLFDLTEKPS
jgi:enoyl-CoA hydratase